MTLKQQIQADIGQKCADDVSAVIRRNIGLLDDRTGVVIVTAYAAAVSVASVTGAFAALNDGPLDLTADDLDQVWMEFIRPMALGELANRMAQ